MKVGDKTTPPPSILNQLPHVVEFKGLVADENGIDLQWQDGRREPWQALRMPWSEADKLLQYLAAAVQASKTKGRR